MTITPCANERRGKGDPEMSTVLLERSSRAPKHKYLTYCADCGRLSYDNEGLCKCGGNETPQRVSHDGEIYSYTTVHQGAEPFVLALIKLSRGPLVTGHDRRRS